MPPKQEKRGRGRGKRPRDAENLRGPPPSKSPHSSGFPAINSPSDTQVGLGQHSSMLQQSSSHIAPGHAPPAQQSGPPPPTPPAPAGKVAIPALRNSRIIESSKALKKGRNPHACDLCRKAKAGCTGGNPCTRCLNANVPCVLGDGKRDKDKKSLFFPAGTRLANMLQEDD